MLFGGMGFGKRPAKKVTPSSNVTQEPTTKAKKG